MNDNPSPFAIHPDEQLEARITAWVLGEASPFEIAELESLVAKSPELQLFLNRTRGLHALLQEAETTANTPSEDWKLPNKKRAKLSPILGEIHVLAPEKESRIRRASFRAAWGIAAVFVVTFFSLRLLPGDYEAEAVIEIKPRERMIDPLGGTMPDTYTFSPQFFGSEFEKIKSRNSLNRVIDNLDLTTRWNTDKETALKRLKDSVETENIRGTDLIAIRVRQPDAQDAKEITAEVTRAYKEYRNDLESRAQDTGINELRKAVRQQEDKVEERRKVLTAIGRTKKIIYHGGRELMQGGQDEDSDEAGIIAQREGQRDALERSIDTTDYVDAKQDFETDLALLEQMKIKLMTEEIASDLPNESVVVHDDAAITGKKIPSNPLAALRKAITPEAKSSAPESPAILADYQMPTPTVTTGDRDRVVAESLQAMAKESESPSQRQLDIAGNTQTQDEVLRREVPARPTGEMQKAVANSVLESTVGDPVVHIGGQVRTPGPQEFKEGLTLGDAVASAGGATEFGSTKRVKLYRDGKTQTYDLSDERLAQIELQPNDTIEMPQKMVFGCGGSRNDILEAPAEQPSDLADTEADFGDGDEFGTRGALADAGAGGSGGGGASPPGEKQNTEMFFGKTKGGAGTLTLSGARDATVDGPDSMQDRASAAPAKSRFAEVETKSEPVPGAVADPFAADDGLKGLAMGGNRSGNAAIERDNLDAILNNPEGAAAPAKPAASAPAPAAAPTPELSKLAEREVLRRQEALTEADEKLLGGREAYANGDYAGAVENYKKALESLPDSPITAGKREVYNQHLNDASIARAREFRKVGKYDEARELLEQAEASAPADGRIREEIAFLDDPIRTNPALTYEHTRDVDEVRRKLNKAEGNMDLGKFDDAKKAYEDTLRVDPYNKAARQGLEKVQAAKSDYYRAAYDHTRSEMLMDVDKDWGLEVPAEERTADLSPPQEAKPSGGAERDARAELLAEVDEAWNRAVPADAAEKNGKEGEQADLFADPAAPGEIATLSGLFLSGDTAQWKGRLDAYTGFRSDTRAGAERSDGTISGGFDGFANYGAPIDGKSNQTDVTSKFTEITQANDKELGFDWILPLDNKNGEVDSYWDTSGAVANAEGKGGVEYEINSRYTSEYLFRGTDLNKHLSGFTGEVEPQSLLTDVTEGGLKNDLSEDASIVEGEVPLIGDIPIVGKLFKPQPIDLADLSQEIPANHEPFSTFSLNISDASFQLALAAVEKGERPDPESIKPEQFYNAVDYGDPAPSSLEPVAAAIDQAAHPVIPGRNLVRVAIRTASTGRSAAQPLRLTLLVDQSGSMARADRRTAMDKALEQLATLLTENDRITVIGFSRTPRLIADSLPGNEAAKISDLINTTASEGGTNLEQAFNLSSELALRHKLDGAQNRIVLFTDGAANLGDADPERLAGRVKELRQQGLAFDIAGIGTNDTNDRLLSELARHGNGRYYLVGENAGDSFAAQLAGAFRPAAENVKVQVKLNPERVGNYKLIGFEKDRLKTEDFHDDSVDAAELAADEAGVAIYQVETLPEGTGEIGEVSVRFRDTASGEMVERAWTIPHDPSTPAFDKAAPQTQLATLALLAAQKLQGGPLADAIRFDDFADTTARLKQAYANDAKAQRLLTLINALR